MRISAARTATGVLAFRVAAVTVGVAVAAAFAALWARSYFVAYRYELTCGRRSLMLDADSGQLVCVVLFYPQFDNRLALRRFPERRPSGRWFRGRDVAGQGVWLDRGGFVVTLAPATVKQDVAARAARSAGATRPARLSGDGPPFYADSAACPCWFAAAAPLAPLAFGWLRRSWSRRRARSRSAARRCASCGYDLRASPGRCPECGAPAAVAATWTRRSLAPRRTTQAHLP